MFWPSLPCPTNLTLVPPEKNKLDLVLFALAEKPIRLPDVDPVDEAVVAYE